jgi:putative RecB family exonuclease
MDSLFDTGEALFEVNPSRLQCYLDCPRMYAFRYVEHRDERRTFSHTALGRSVHKALRDFYALRPDERTLVRLLDSLRRSWDASGWASQTDEEDGQARAEAMLKTFFASDDHAKVRPLALESKFAWSDAKARILVTGRVDRLDASDDGYVVIDYKTGRYRGMNLDDSLPLSLYAMAAGGRLGRDVSRIRLHFLASGDRAETTRDRTRLADDWKLVVDIVDEMRGGVFPAKPGPLCKWCDFLSVCPEGQAEQAPPVESEG